MTIYLRTILTDFEFDSFGIGSTDWKPLGKDNKEPNSIAVETNISYDKSYEKEEKKDFINLCHYSAALLQKYLLNYFKTLK